MTTEEKARAYDEAIVKMQEWKRKYIASGVLSKDGTIIKDLESIFPKLCESEDERIRKELMVFISQFAPEHLKVKYMAWLEKQKERGPLTKEEEYELHRIIEFLEDEKCQSKWISLLHDISCLPYEKYEKQKEMPTNEEMRRTLLAEYAKGVADTIAKYEQKKQKPEHFELKAGKWYICHRAFCCRADHLTVKEGERFQCEKDGIVKGFVIKEPEKYFKECSAPAPMEDEQKEQREKIERAPQGDVVTMLLSDTNTSKSDSILSGRADQKPYEPKNWPADKENLSQGQKPELVRYPSITYTYNSNASRDERLQAALLALLGSDLIQVNDGGYFTKQDLIEWVKKKPSELSEEDVKMIGRIRSVVNECASYNDALDVNGDYCEGDYAKLDAWLKSLPLNLKKKNEDVAKLCSNEWSEEDEEMLNDLIGALERNQVIHPDGYLTVDKVGNNKRRVKDFVSWLKSLRPSWKPSKHQMDILKAVKDYVGKGSGYWGEGLGSLIEDLEKLM